MRIIFTGSTVVIPINTRKQFIDLYKIWYSLEQLVEKSRYYAETYKELRINMRMPKVSIEVYKIVKILLEVNKII